MTLLCLAADVRFFDDWSCLHAHVTLSYGRRGGMAVDEARDAVQGDGRFWFKGAVPDDPERQQFPIGVDGSLTFSQAIMILQRTMTEAGTVGYAPTVSESYALGTVFEKERRRVRQWAISAMAGGLAGTWMARRRGLMVGWARGVLGSTFLAVSCGYVIAMSSVKEVARVACALDTPTGAEARHWSQVAKTGLTFSVAPYHRELFESIPRLASAAKLEQEAEEARLIREAEATGDATRLRAFREWKWAQHARDMTLRAREAKLPGQSSDSGDGSGTTTAVAPLPAPSGGDEAGRGWEQDESVGGEGSRDGNGWGDGPRWDERRGGDGGGGGEMVWDDLMGSSDGPEGDARPRNGEGGPHGRRGGRGRRRRDAPGNAEDGRVGSRGAEDD